MNRYRILEITRQKPGQLLVKIGEELEGKEKELKNSNLVIHAERELTLAGWKEPDAFYGDMMFEAVMELVRVFARQGHSGMSAGICLSIFSKIARFEPLTPLTNDPREWNEVSEDNWQSARQPSCFSEDRGKTYYNLNDEEREMYESEPTR